MTAQWEISNVRRVVNVFRMIKFVMVKRTAWIKATKQWNVAQPIIALRMVSDVDTEGALMELVNAVGIVFVLT